MVAKAGPSWGLIFALCFLCLSLLTFAKASTLYLSSIAPVKPDGRVVTQEEIDRDIEEARQWRRDHPDEQ